MKFYEAGYILVNGQFLDLSEKKDGGQKGKRNADHRFINEFYGKESGTEALICFMNDGNIRLMPECGGIDISVKPNDKQISALRTFINYFNGEIILDISDKNGDNLFNKEYTIKTASARIINDIINYFEK